MDALELGLLFSRRLLGIHTESMPLNRLELDAFSQNHLFKPLIKIRNDLPKIAADLNSRDIVHVVDPLGVRVSLVHTGECLCVFGPFITETRSTNDLKRLSSEIRLSEDHLEAFQLFINGLSHLTINSISYATHTLLQGIYGSNSSAKVYYVNQNEPKYTRLQAESAGSPVTTMPQQLFANVIRSSENIGLLYRLEATLADQMMNGQTANALGTLQQIESIYQHGVQGTQDLEYMKINTTALCTMMRLKSIQAGVQPIIAETRARYFLSLIRSALSPDAISNLRKYMLAQFCDLIRKEKLSTLSPKIRQIVQFIMSDLSGDLRAENLAAQVDLSANYLSTSFKKELNQPLSTFIREKRMESAAQFLRYTNLSIHDVATCVGITDFSYFAKVFKDKYGVSPSAYRNQ